MPCAGWTLALSAVALSQPLVTQSGRAVVRSIAHGLAICGDAPRVLVASARYYEVSVATRSTWLNTMCSQDDVSRSGLICEETHKSALGSASSSTCVVMASDRCMHAERLVILPACGQHPLADLRSGDRAGAADLGNAEAVRLQSSGAMRNEPMSTCGAGERWS